MKTKTLSKYSVLMTVYRKDNPNFFETALLSMLNQTIKPDEIILVKDGPITEEIQAVINKLNKKHHLIKEIQLDKNAGLGLALNEGIKECRNELIARMDADDISDPTRCEKQLQAFQEDSELDIVGCPVKEFSGDIMNIVGKRDVPLDNASIHAYARKRDPFNHPTVMYRKSRLNEVGCYSDLRKNQDTDLWIRMLQNGAKCKNIDEYLLLFRFDDNTYKKRKKWLNTQLLINIRWEAFKNKFCSLSDFLQVAGIQLAIFILPASFQRFIYKKILRR